MTLETLKGLHSVTFNFVHEQLETYVKGSEKIKGEDMTIVCASVATAAMSILATSIEENSDKNISIPLNVLFEEASIHLASKMSTEEIQNELNK